MLAEVRNELKSEGITALPEKWQSAMDTHFLENVQSGNIKYAKAYLKDTLSTGDSN